MPSVLAVADYLTHLYPLIIVFDEKIEPGILYVDHRSLEVRIHPDAKNVKPGGTAGWSNHG
jgi:hypothetical protein